MIVRIALAAAALVLAAFVLRHPAAGSAFRTQAAPTLPAPRPTAQRRRRSRLERAAVVVYVAGSVRKPGLYKMPPGARAADAVAMAAGMAPDADPAGVNLAAVVADGDEIDVPARGQRPLRRARTRSRRTRRTLQTPAAVDVNAAGAAQLAAVPGIGNAVAQRIVALRATQGPFASLDELLDVAGMTQSRLDRARAYLVSP